MALISCPVCSNGVSEDAPTCPHCGHPIAGTFSEVPPKNVVVKNTISNAEAWFVGVFLSICLILLMAGLSKPNKDMLEDEFNKQNGAIISGVSKIGQGLGLVNINYHDYLVYSSLTLSVVGQPEQTVAIGMFGKPIAYDIRPYLKTAREPEMTTLSQSERQPETLSNPTLPTEAPAAPANTIANVNAFRSGNTAANMNVAIPVQRELTPDELEASRSIATASLKDIGMWNSAKKEMQKQHPMSNIEGCMPAKYNTFDQPGGSVQVKGTFTCNMRGTITGQNVFQVVVEVTGKVSFANGRYTSAINPPQVVNDNQVQ